MRGLRFGLAVVVSTACIAAVPSTSASASTHRTITIYSNSISPCVGSAFTLDGVVSPNARGQAIALQQRQGNKPWVKVTTEKLGPQSKYVFTRRLHAVGVYQFRAKFGSVVSRAETIGVVRGHYLSDLPRAASSPAGCVTTGSAQIGSVTYPHTVSMDLTCGGDVSADWNLAPGCLEYHAIEFFTDASSSDAQATLSLRDGTHVLSSVTESESENAPGVGVFLGGHIVKLRLEANAASGTTPIAAFGNAEIECTW
jgi:hypothetical protein